MNYLVTMVNLNYATCISDNWDWFGDRGDIIQFITRMTEFHSGIRIWPGIDDAGITRVRLRGEGFSIVWKNLLNNIKGFSNQAQDIIEHFGFEERNGKLEKNNRLYLIVQKFCEIDTYPEYGPRCCRMFGTHGLMRVRQRLGTLLILIDISMRTRLPGR